MTNAKSHVTVAGTAMKPNGTKRAKGDHPRSVAESPVQKIPSASQFGALTAAQEKRYQELFCSGGLHVGRAVLTLKELQLLELLSYGYENGDIADHFHTSLQAVKNMLRTINLKLGADNRTHAVSICFRNEWLPLTTVEDVAPEPDLRAKSRNR